MDEARDIETVSLVRQITDDMNRQLEGSHLFGTERLLSLNELISHTGKMSAVALRDILQKEYDDENPGA